MKILIVIPLWKRQEVTRFCFNELKKVIAESKHEIEVLCVISEPEYIDVCEKYKFNWVACSNFPLGKKINAGIRRALAFKWDYLMTMNSDNVIKTKLIDEVYQPFFEKSEPFFGVNKVTYVKFGTDQAIEYTYDDSILGIAKCIRRDVVKKAFDELGYLYNPDKNKGLDDSCMDTIVNLGYSRKFVKYEGQLAMDFKSDVNIWPFEFFLDKGKEVCYKAV